MVEPTLNSNPTTDVDSTQHESSSAG